jgi:hypothetical protein
MTNIKSCEHQKHGEHESMKNIEENIREEVGGITKKER